MKTDRNILIAFILNLVFSVLEFIGGSFTNSVAIVSDSLHDMGDALSIGVSYFLEKKSKKKPDDKYTYGYVRYSVIGSIITSSILLFGSIIVIYNAINRLINPMPINYNGMILFAVLGVVINFLAAYWTKGGKSLNERAVNLHMLEDVLGWVVVLIGAIIMKFSNISVIDPILSILVALFILINVFRNFKLIIDIFLEKTPKGINVTEIKKHLLEIENVEGIHHIHVWSIDGNTNYATLHVVISGDSKIIKDKVREELQEHGINHITIEIENQEEKCETEKCLVSPVQRHHHHH